MPTTALTLQTAYSAAAEVTRRSVTTVAADYVDWLEDQDDLAIASAALAAAAKWSKSPARVLVKADELYEEIVGVLDSDDPPVFTSITPTGGTNAGGTTTVIVGTDLTGVTSVTFGGVAGTAFSVVDDEHIHVTAPAHANGAVTVALVGGLGGTVSAPTAYTYS